eukprot:1185565-Prorocentrum_minimum.AAC.1
MVSVPSPYCAPAKGLVSTAGVAGGSTLTTEVTRCFPFLIRVRSSQSPTAQVKGQLASRGAAMQSAPVANRPLAS